MNKNADRICVFLGSARRQPAAVGEVFGKKARQCEEQENLGKCLRKSCWV
jgi:hypothetical protein